MLKRQRSKWKAIIRLLFISPIGFLFLLFYLISDAGYSQSYTLSGYVSDANTGERLIGATVLDTLHQQGLATNTYGFYSLTLPAGKIILRVSYLGYQEQYYTLDLARDTTLSLTLTLADRVLSEVEITDQRERLSGTQMSTISLRPVDIAHVPMLLGEADLMKAIQLLPGVQGGTEGTTSAMRRVCPSWKG